MKKIVLDPLDLLKIYAILLGFNLIFFGTFCIKPGRDLLKEKRQTKKQLEKIHQDLQTKKTNLQSMGEDLEKNQPYIEGLNRAIPKNADMDIFLLDFIEVAATNGFVVESFRSTEKPPQTNELNIKLSGLVIENTPNLVKDIENLERLTTLDDVKIEIRKQELFVSLKLKIYKSKTI